MGTINYGTSDYITLGIKPYDYSDFENDTDFMEYINDQISEYGGSVEEYIYQTICDYEEEDYSNIESELKKHSFWYYHITIEHGYYEGFYLNIESNFPVAFDSWEDRRAANKEITKIKQCLIECAGMGLVEVWPGWCTSYKDYKTTIESINKAIRGMREEVKETPTWKQYNRDCA